MKKIMMTGSILLLFVAGCCCGGEKLPLSLKDIKMPLLKGTKIIDVGEKSSVKTIEEALVKVAEIRKSDVKTPLALRIHPGDYSTDNRLVISKEHASTNFAPLVIYAADFSKKPHIHGGALLTNWKKVRFHGKDNVWVADASILSNTVPMTILFNGSKMLPARWPNLELNGNPYRSDFVLVGDKDVPAGMDKKSVKEYSDELWRRNEDIRKWEHPEDGTAVIFPLHYYGTSAYRITGVSNRVIQLDRKREQLTGLHRYDIWSVINIAEELDIPGEWYLDPREKKIYFMTPDGSDPNRAVITVTKHAQPVISLKNVGNLTLAGLEVSGGGDGIYFNGAAYHVELLGCSIHDIGGSNHRGGGTGLNLNGMYLRVADCDIYNIGNNGIWHNSCGPADINGRQHNVIENNYIHHCGVVGTWNFGQGLTYRNNLIHDIDGAAFSGYGRFLDIAYNRIRHVCIAAQDMGALYDSGWGNGTGTKIRYNWISDSIGKNRNRYYVGACGIYFDECTGGAEVYGNLVEHMHWSAMHLHCARWLTISNNVFVSNADLPITIHSWQFSIADWGPYKRGFGNRDLHVGEYNLMVKKDPNWKKFPAFSQDANTEEIYSNDGWMMMGNQFKNNIFYYPDQGASAKFLNASHLNLTTNFWNKNVYWPGTQKDGTVREVLMNTHREEGMSFKAWLAAGQDKDSLITDPLFVDPANKDFRLKPESPALKLGFVDLPYDKMGLYKSMFRPELPEEVEGLREHPEWLKPIAKETPTTKVQPVKEYIAIDLSKGSKAEKFAVSTIKPSDLSEITDEYKTDKLLMARIPAGSFMMQGNKPVTLTKDFYMGVFEVTQKQYENVVGLKPSFFKGDMRPVDSVSWIDSTNFCAVLSKKTGLNITLPTEAQWEYACRAGTTAIYNNGTDKLEGLARYYDSQIDGKGGNYKEHTVVGSYSPNAWGLYDMHGNVWEPCSDGMNWELGIEPVADPTGPELRPWNKTIHIIRGGSWHDFAVGCTSIMRFYDKEFNRDYIFGLRISSTIEK